MVFCFSFLRVRSKNLGFLFLDLYVCLFFFYFFIFLFCIYLILNLNLNKPRSLSWLLNQKVWNWTNIVCLLEMFRIYKPFSEFFFGFCNCFLIHVSMGFPSVEHVIWLLGTIWWNLYWSNCPILISASSSWLKVISLSIWSVLFLCFVLIEVLKK